MGKGGSIECRADDTRLLRYLLLIGGIFYLAAGACCYMAGTEQETYCRHSSRVQELDAWSLLQRAIVIMTVVSARFPMNRKPVPSLGCQIVQIPN